MIRILAAILLLAAAAFAQSESKPIQDNSFFLEEAYNQEDGVIQHISNFTRLGSGDWGYTFTEEWPVTSQKHQLSLTLAAVNAGDTAGFGDTMVNYRYQLIGSGETDVAFAPRISFILPTGSVQRGRGNGAFGLQANLPLSVEIGKHFVTHWNAGATIIPRAENLAGDRGRLTGFNLGQSTIWLAHQNFNVMMETLFTGTDALVGPDLRVREHDLFLSPGVRWAHNFASGLQIVPGVAVPIGVGNSAGRKGLVLYVSFEHPFKAIAGK